MKEIIKNHYVDIIAIGMYAVYIPLFLGTIYYTIRERPSAEEITSVLYVLRMGSSHYERSIIDYLIDKIDERRAKDE